MIRESQRYTKGLFSVVGYRKKAIEFEREPRLAGETKWNYLSLADLAIEGITSFTIMPLRIAIFLGVFISIFSFIYLFYIVISALTIGNDVPGYPSLMSVILFLGGVQLVSLGIIGEYLGRVFNETKRRPLYFVNSFNNDDVSSNEIPSEVVDRS